MYGKGQEGIFLSQLRLRGTEMDRTLPLVWRVEHLYGGGYLEAYIGCRLGVARNAEYAAAR